MPIIYTVFPLNSNVSVNIFTINYDCSGPLEALNNYYSDHTLELITYQIGSITFTDIQLYRLVAGGRTIIRNLTVDNASLRSPKSLILSIHQQLTSSTRHLHNEANLVLVQRNVIFHSGSTNQSS